MRLSVCLLMVSLALCCYQAEALAAKLEVKHCTDQISLRKRATLESSC
ncbi:LOW QUALITY PROTEIN: SCGB1D4 isoform 1 [Pongo abelii]|uniref:SCGB1D4 isoform 1 n=1 Tax=Pongo abelii TaxID=9601 RepID=A0A2J8TXQ8_PONAB|nr:LOW QUALITY PROTEIN: SCGB1D4 isoform 1 [Pongo abelii]